MTPFWVFSAFASLALSNNLWLHCDHIFCFYLMRETRSVEPPISTLPHYTIYRSVIWVAVYFSILTRLFKIIFWQFGDIWTILILPNFDCLRIIICHRATSLDVEWWLDRYLVLCHSINPISSLALLATPSHFLLIFATFYLPIFLIYILLNQIWLFSFLSLLTL